eukprot:PhM_4_TR12245/c0_g1_i1/m.48805
MKTSEHSQPSGTDVASVIRTVERCLTSSKEKCLFLRPDFILCPLLKQNVPNVASCIEAAVYRVAEQLTYKSKTSPSAPSSGPSCCTCWFTGAERCAGMLPTLLCDMIFPTSTSNNNNSSRRDTLGRSLRILQMLTSESVLFGLFEARGRSEAPPPPCALAPKLLICIDVDAEASSSQHPTRVSLSCEHSIIIKREGRDDVDQEEDKTAAASAAAALIVDSIPLSTLYTLIQPLCDNDDEYITFLKTFEVVQIAACLAKLTSNDNRSHSTDTELLVRMCELLGQSVESVLATAFRSPPQSTWDVIIVPLISSLVEWVVERCNRNLLITPTGKKKIHNEKSHIHSYRFIVPSFFAENDVVSETAQFLGIPVMAKPTPMTKTTTAILSSESSKCDFVVHLLNHARRSLWSSDITQSLVLKCIDREYQRPSIPLHFADFLSRFGHLLLPSSSKLNSPFTLVEKICCENLSQSAFFVDATANIVVLSTAGVGVLGKLAAATPMPPPPPPPAPAAPTTTASTMTTSSPAMISPHTLMPMKRPAVNSTTPTKSQQQQQSQQSQHQQSHRLSGYDPFNVRFEDVVRLTRSAAIRCRTAQQHKGQKTTTTTMQSTTPRKYPARGASSLSRPANLTTPKKQNVLFVLDNNNNNSNKASSAQKRPETGGRGQNGNDKKSNTRPQTQSRTISSHRHQQQSVQFGETQWRQMVYETEYI